MADDHRLYRPSVFPLALYLNLTFERVTGIILPHPSAIAVETTLFPCNFNHGFLSSTYRWINLSMFWTFFHRNVPFSSVTNI
jgi:hypothetical protein